MANRLFKSAVVSYKNAIVNRENEPFERASVIIPGAFGILMVFVGTFVIRGAIGELPIAVAKHYYPDAFAAQQLLNKTK